MKKRALAAAVAGVSVLFGSAATAGAVPEGKNKADVVGAIERESDGTAEVRVRYVCQPQSSPLHVWVSAKQSADGKRDDRLMEEGSSQVAAAWLQSHPTEFTCNGRWHVQSFPIDTQEQGKGTLQRGRAWVQFCLTLEDGPEGVLLINRTEWVRVR